MIVVQNNCSEHEHFSKQNSILIEKRDFRMLKNKTQFANMIM